VFPSKYLGSSGALLEAVQVFRRGVDMQFRGVYKENTHGKSIKT
jgi:hypothetical protein